MTDIFPRSVFDSSGQYTISEGAAYEVNDPRINRYAAIVYARRDLQHAMEFIEVCCDNEIDEIHPALEQAAWTAALVNYAKPFSKSNARSPKKLTELSELFDDGTRASHLELLDLRDKMFAHDDGLGESKLVSLYLPSRPPRSHMEVGIGVGTWRVLGLGQDRAKLFLPHFAHVLCLCTALERQVEAEVKSSLVSSAFSGISLLGLAREDQPNADVSAYHARSR